MIINNEICSMLLTEKKQSIKWVLNKASQLSDLGCRPKGLVFVQAAITKCHRLGGFNNGNLFSHNSGGLEVQDKSVGRVGFFSLWL